MKKIISNHSKLTFNFFKLQSLPLSSRIVAILVVLFLFIPTVYSQDPGVAIGDSVRAADASALLELFSDSKGFLPPRMTTAQRDSIDTPADGLVVFDTDLGKLLYYYDGSWDDLGLWSIYKDRIMNKNSRPVIIGHDERAKQLVDLFDSLSWNMPRLTLWDSITSAIYSTVMTDSIIFPFLPHFFLANLNSPGEYAGNVIVNTDRSGDPDGTTSGLFSFLESNDHMSSALVANTLYSGTGGNIYTLEVPFSAGMIGGNEVLDSTVSLMSMGGQFSSISSQGGINIGAFAEAYSPATYANIGLNAVVNVPDESDEPFQTLLDSFPVYRSSIVIQ